MIFGRIRTPRGIAPRVLCATHALLVLALLIPGAARAASATSSLENNADYASALLYASGQDYLDAYRAFRRAYRSDRDVPVVWYNMGLAAAHIPGYEFRAAALLRAYELADASDADPPVDGAIRSLEGAANAEIDTLSQAEALSNNAQAKIPFYETAPCEARDALVENALSQIGGGDDAAANRLIRKAKDIKACTKSIPNGNSETVNFALAYASGGHFKRAAAYAAKFVRQNPQPCHGSLCSLFVSDYLNLYQRLAFDDIEANRMSDARANEHIALHFAQALKGQAAAAGAPYSSPEARLLYCVDSEWAWRTPVTPGEARAQLAIWRNLAYSRDPRYQSSDSELVLDAATYDAEGDYAWADTTAGAIHDVLLRAQWLGYRLPNAVVKFTNGESMPSLESTDQITGALIHEPELLRCLGNSYFANLLLRIGTGAVRFHSCPKWYATLASCIGKIQSIREDVRTRAWQLEFLLDQVLTLKQTIFRSAWYEHSAKALALDR